MKRWQGNSDKWWMKWNGKWNLWKWSKFQTKLCNIKWYKFYKHFCTHLFVFTLFWHFIRMQTRSKWTTSTLTNPVPRPVPVARRVETETSSIQSLRDNNEILANKVRELESQLPHPTFSSQHQWQTTNTEDRPLFHQYAIYKCTYFFQYLSCYFPAIVKAKHSFVFVSLIGTEILGKKLRRN